MNRKHMTQEERFSGVRLRTFLTTHQAEHLYYSVDTYLRKASELSTYILDRLIPDMDVPYSADYSFSAMMPSVMLTKSGVDQIKWMCDFAENHSWNHIIIPMEMAIDKNDYIVWAQGLRNQHVRSNDNKF